MSMPPTSAMLDELRDSLTDSWGVILVARFLRKAVGPCRCVGSYFPDDICLENNASFDLVSSNRNHDLPAPVEIRKNTL